jgi:mono/diheme cytochrome c family protein
MPFSWGTRSCGRRRHVDQKGKSMINYARPFALATMSLLLSGAALSDSSANGDATETQLQRGKYLVEFSTCTDCHTPGSLRGHPDMSKFLAGSDVGFAVPGLGIFVPPNLTPDATGLGNWTTQQIATAITTGERPDGRILAPIMPWRSISHLTKSDAQAIAVYLKSLPPVHNKVPGPLGPTEKPTVSVSVVLQPDVYSGLPAHPVPLGAK